MLNIITYKYIISINTLVISYKNSRYNWKKAYLTVLWLAQYIKYKNVTLYICDSFYYVVGRKRVTGLWLDWLVTLVFALVRRHRRVSFELSRRSIIFDKVDW